MSDQNILSDDKLEAFKAALRSSQDPSAQTKAQTQAGESVGAYKTSVESELSDSAEKDAAEARLRCEEFEQKLQESQDKYLRLYAEFDNFRKRALKEREEAVRQGSEKVLKELLPVLDGLEKALEHSHESSEQKSIVEGIELLKKQMLKSLEGCGLKGLEARGQTFDPNYHEAMGYHESDEHPPHTVVHEYRRGYLLNDRLLRPALVTVAKPFEKKGGS